MRYRGATELPAAELEAYRQLLIDSVLASDPAGAAELALSGGVDSAAILFAMLELGRKPTCFTFYCQDTISEDLQSARALCRHFGLKLREVEIPWDLEELERVLRDLVLPACHNIRKKTIVQCVHPWAYLYPRMESHLALCGLGADDLLCSQRKVQVKLNTEGEDALWEAGWRGRSYTKDLNFSSANIVRFGERYGKTLVDSYDTPGIHRWFEQFPVKLLHTPFEKAATVLAWRDYFAQGAFRRAHSSYQVNSKLKVLHEQLLGTRLNTRGAKDVVSIYKDLAEGKV